MIGYRDAVTGDKWVGEQVHPDNEFLCLTKRDNFWQIYNVITGKPYLRIKFHSKDVAFQFGSLLHKWYGEYFWIWKANGWRDADIPSLVRWTIPKGNEIYQAIETLKMKEIVYDLEIFSGLL